MTKGKNKSLKRRKLRRAEKNTNVDVGVRGSGKHISYGYGNVASVNKFPKNQY
jgi:hypothetical protein